MRNLTHIIYRLRVNFLAIVSYVQILNMLRLFSFNCNQHFSMDIHSMKSIHYVKSKLDKNYIKCVT